MISEKNDLISLTLAVNGPGGPRSGLSAVVSLRSVALGFYLDWSDLTFKATPAIQQGALTDVGNGLYTRPLDLSLVTNLTVGQFVLEYETLSPAQKGVSVEDLTIVESLYDTPSDTLAKVIDGAIDLETVLKRLNSYVRGKVVLDASPSPDTDVEYYAEDGTTKLFENRKKLTEREPQ